MKERKKRKKKERTILSWLEKPFTLISLGILLLPLIFTLILSSLELLDVPIKSYLAFSTFISYLSITPVIIFIVCLWAFFKGIDMLKVGKIVKTAYINIFASIVSLMFLVFFFVMEVSEYYAAIFIFLVIGALLVKYLKRKVFIPILVLILVITIVLSVYVWLDWYKLIEDAFTVRPYIK